jgi:hypothetical protein
MEEMEKEVREVIFRPRIRPLLPSLVEIRMGNLSREPGFRSLSRFPNLVHGEKAVEGVILGSVVAQGRAGVPGNVGSPGR